LLAIRKPDSVDRAVKRDGRSFICALDRSRARVVRVLSHGADAAALPAQHHFKKVVLGGHGLALGKDFAVSLPLCSPYGGIGPSSSGRGPSGRFRPERHCSHLCSCERRLLAATFLSAQHNFFKVVLDRRVSGLSSARLSPHSDRLDDQQNHYSTRNGLLTRNLCPRHRV